MYPVPSYLVLSFSLVCAAIAIGVHCCVLLVLMLRPRLHVSIKGEQNCICTSYGLLECCK